MASSQWVAIDSSTDRRQWARKLRRAHERGLAGATAQPEVREVIDQSWRRSARAHFDPIGGIAPLVISGDEAAARWDSSPLRVAEPILREMFADIGTAGQQVVLVCDADGTMLWIDGEPGVLEEATAIHLERGARWSEESAGTNAMGTALAAGHPLQVFSAEHFAVSVHEWTCSAAPIRDPETGETLGVLDLSGELATAHPHSLALVEAAARMIEAELAQRGGASERRLCGRATASASAAAPRSTLVTRSGPRSTLVNLCVTRVDRAGWDVTRVDRGQWRWARRAGGSSTPMRRSSSGGGWRSRARAARSAGSWGSRCWPSGSTAAVS